MTDDIRGLENRRHAKIYHRRSASDEPSAGRAHAAVERVLDNRLGAYLLAQRTADVAGLPPRRRPCALDRHTALARL